MPNKRIRRRVHTTCMPISPMRAPRALRNTGPFWAPIPVFRDVIVGDIKPLLGRRAAQRQADNPWLRRAAPSRLARRRIGAVSGAGPGDQAG